MKWFRAMAAAVIFFCFIQEVAVVQGKDWKDSISLEEVQETFDKLQGTEGNFSIRDYVSQIAAGEKNFSMRELTGDVLSQIKEQFRNQSAVLLKILALGLLAGIFANFSGTIGDKSLGETGGYIVYLVLFVTMTAGFGTVYRLSEDALENLITFMRALVPTFSLTLCLGGGEGTSLAYYEVMLIAMSFLEDFMLKVLLPGIEVFFVIGMLSPLSDNHFSKLAGLIKSFLSWCAKLIFGVLIGYQGIQGLILPVLDRLKNNTVWQTARGLPGVGNTVGSIADTLAGSGILLKSAVGVGGVICIALICLYPLLKILVFMLMYRIGGAVLQPVSDRKMVEALQVAADSGKLLLEYILAGSMLFVFSILIVLVSVKSV